MTVRSTVSDIYDKKNGALEFVVKLSRATNQRWRTGGRAAHGAGLQELAAEPADEPIEFDTVQVGDALPALQLPPVTRTTLALFAGASGDHNPIHIDIDVARRAGMPDVFAQGMLGMAWLGRLLTGWAPQSRLRRFDARFQGITHLGNAHRAAAAPWSRSSSRPASARAHRAAERQPVRPDQDRRRGAGRAALKTHGRKSMTSKLEGKVALVTGSGRGIGRAIALKLASEGARIVVNDLDAEPAQEAVQAIREAGGQAVACVGSVTAPDFAERFVDTAVDEYKGLDIIVNNAGYTWDNVIQKMTDEQWYAMLDCHLTAPFRILRAAQPVIRALGKAEAEAGQRVMRKVVNISSVAGLFGNAGQANYSTAKAGIVGLTQTLAKEWGRMNVTRQLRGLRLHQDPAHRQRRRRRRPPASTAATSRSASTPS